MEQIRTEAFADSEEYFESVLREAKEENRLSAKRTLAELYHTADGERQSDTEAMRWYALAALQAMNEYAAQAREYYGRALEISESVAADENTNEARDDLAVANYRLGFIEYLFSGEKTRLDKAYDIWEQLYEETGNYEYRRRRSVIDTLYATAEVPQEQRAAAAEPAGVVPAEEYGRANKAETPEMQKGRKKSGAAAVAVIAIIAVLLAVGAWLLCR